MKKILKNNIYMLAFIKKYAKSLIYISVINIFFKIGNTYIELNLGKWILDSVYCSKMQHIFIMLLTIVTILFLFSGISTFFVEYIMTFAKIELTKNMVGKIISKIAEVDQVNFENTEFYDKYSRALNEIKGRAEDVLGIFASFISSIIQFFLVSIVLVALDYRITGIILLAAILDTVFASKMNKIEYDVYQKNTCNERKVAYINRIIYQPEYNKDMRRFFGFSSTLKNMYFDNVTGVVKVMKQYRLKRLIIQLINMFIHLILVMLVPWLIIVSGLLNGTMTVGDATVIMNATVILPTTFQTLFGTVSNLQKESLYISNLREILEFKNSEYKEEDCNCKDKKMIISTSNLYFAYPKSTNYVLEDINIEIKEKEKIALVGLNGEGKTTLINLLSGLYKSKKGGIFYKGKSVNSYNKSELQKDIFVLEQDYNIYSFTIAENVLMREPKSSEDYELVDEALNAVGLYDKIHDYPEGVDSVFSKEFNENGIYFSGGEKQKLALARAYASKASLLILDEPTSSMDPQNENKIINLISNIFREKTVIVISHHLSVVKNMDKIILLDKKCVAEQGTHKQLMERKGKYYKLYMLQQGYERL